MKIGKPVSGILAAVLALGMLTASGPDALSQEKTMVGGVLYARDSQYWRLIEKGMQDAADQYGADLTIGLNQRQLATEAQVVEDMMTRGVKAIIISILDNKASAAILRDARSRGIVVVEDGTHLEDTSVANYSVSVDQKQLAEVVANKMKEYINTELGGKAKVGLVVLPPQNPQAHDRNDTVADILSGAGVEIVAQVVANTPETGANAAEQILQVAPDVDLIYAANAGALEGVAAAVPKMGSKAKIYGIDLSRAMAVELLNADSNLMAVSDQDPHRVGFMAAEAGIKGARGTMEGGREIELPVKLYTHETPEQTQAYIDLVDSVSQ